MSGGAESSGSAFSLEWKAPLVGPGKLQVYSLTGRGPKDTFLNDVEAICHPAGLVEHHHVVGDHITHLWVEAQGRFTAGNEPCRRGGLRARKERDERA